MPTQKQYIPISEDFLRTAFKECSYHIPNKLKYGLVYYVVNTRFKIDEIDLFKLMNTTIKIINPMMPHNWFYPALIASDTIPLEEIKVNIFNS